MKSHAESALVAAGAEVENRLREVLAQKHPGPVGAMLGYFFGFLDVDMQPLSKSVGGKRFRPSLCLYLAEAYGNRASALDAALSIELFHTFTLIHDDISDRDETRRNRPTLWKLFGTDRAMYAGDALLITANDIAAQSPAVNVLLDAFREVIEGQYMDFELASETLGPNGIAEARYMDMTQKKTGALIGAAAEAAGIAAGKGAAECANLRVYGNALGVVFQLADDYHSVWSSQEETGKDAQSDIREHKRTLPLLFAYTHTAEKEKLASLYNLGRQLHSGEIQEALSIMSATSAREDVLASIYHHAQKAYAAADSLVLSSEVQAVLKEVVNALVPEGAEQ